MRKFHVYTLRNLMHLHYVLFICTIRLHLGGWAWSRATTMHSQKEPKNTWLQSDIFSGRRKWWIYHLWGWIFRCSLIWSYGFLLNWRMWRQAGVLVNRERDFCWFNRAPPNTFSTGDSDSPSISLTSEMKKLSFDCQSYLSFLYQVLFELKFQICFCRLCSTSW